MLSRVVSSSDLNSLSKVGTRMGDHASQAKRCLAGEAGDASAVLYPFNIIFSIIKSTTIVDHINRLHPHNLKRTPLSSPTAITTHLEHEPAEQL